MTALGGTPASSHPDSDGCEVFYVDKKTPVYTITIVSQITNIHPQTLRQYDRLGLVVPHRVNGKNRLYSHTDVEKLFEIKQLTKDSINLEGIRRILELRNRILVLENIVNKNLNT